MRNLGNHAIHLLMWVVTFVMIYVLYGVLSQPMVYGDEPKQEILKPGYIPQAVERPQIDSKRFSRSEGYLYTPETGKTRHIELRSYRYGNQTFYEGPIARANIQVEPEIRGALRKED